MAKRLTSKQRASRIPLDYHRHADGIRASRQVLTALAALVAVGLVIGTAISRDWHAAAISPGPVARVHATWEQKCSACHESFEPIRSDAWLATHRGDHSSNVADNFRVSALKCESCHRGAPHYSWQSATESQNCTACHHEHTGRDSLISAVDDVTCTRCHADLQQPVATSITNTKATIGNVTGFPRQHPEFRSLERDPTQLKFNHQRHLFLGLRLPDERHTGWTLADIDPAHRDQYRKPNDAVRDQDLSALVQLECADCHRAASAQSTTADLLPVVYEQHCRGCHPLTYQREGRGDVPHGMELPSLRELLAGRFWEAQLKDKPQLVAQSPHPRPIPGQSPDPLRREAEATVTRQTQDAVRHLRSVTCAKCHDFVEEVAMDQLPHVRPVQMPALWFKNARFHHASHRAVDCRECHARAFPDEPHASTHTADVLIAGQSKCRECHSPQNSAGDRGGADFRCIECHRYHHGELGRPDGSHTPLLPAVRHSLPQFLRGDHAQD